MAITIMFKSFAFIFGGLIGSFLNVLIFRIPRGRDFVKERSHCPKCNKLIFWYENIPVISYIFLRGKCSKCNSGISIRYPLVELICAVAACLMFPGFIDNSSLASFAFYFSIFCAFVVHFFIDLEHKILPDGINIYLALMLGIFSIFNYSYKYWLFGGAIGFLFPAGVTYAFYALRGKVGLGGGDIKLFAVLGLYLGPIGIIYNIMFSCILGSVVGISLIVTKVIGRNTQIPFGPFIIIVAVFQIFLPKYFNTLLRTLF